MFEDLHLWYKSFAGISEGPPAHDSHGDHQNRRHEYWVRCISNL